MTSQNTTQISKLSGQENYATWSFSMQMLLIDNDLWDCVQDTFSATSNELVKRDARARAKICLMLSEGIYPLVTEAKTARETWLALKNAYADAGLMRRLSLLRKMFRIKLESYPSMEAYVTEVRAIQQQLRSIGAGLDDEFVGIIMLAGLTDNYNPLVMAIEHSRSTITSELVISALLKEGQRQESNEAPRDDSALASSAGGSGGREHTREIVCHFCKRKGHFKWQCKQFKAKQPDKKKSNANSAMMTSVNANSDFLTLLSSVGSSDNWVLDSGATSHMTPVKSLLNPTKSCSKTITCANSEKIVSTSQGSVELNLRHGERDTVVKMNDVLHIPELITNLMSVGKFADAGNIIVFDKTKCSVFNNNVKIDGKALFTAPRQNGLYVIGSGCNQATALLGEDNQDKFELWHRRLGHLSPAQMYILKRIVQGLDYGKKGDGAPCVPCSQGKQCVKKFPKRKKSFRASGMLDLIHSDVAGPIDVETWGGNRYLLLFIDDFSRKVFGYVMKHKTEVLEKFKEFKRLVENQTERKIKRFRSDNGTEYTNKEFQAYLAKYGITHQTSVTHTPQQNGVAERTIRTITEKARCMLHDSNLSKRYWGEAVGTAIYLKNRSPTLAIAGKVPEEVWTNHEVDFTNLKVFGSTAQVLVKDNSRRKFDSKTRELVFVGYSEVQKGYRFVNPVNPRRIIVARDAVFDERSKVIKEIKPPERSVQVSREKQRREYIEVPIFTEPDTAQGTSRAVAPEDGPSQSNMVMSPSSSPTSAEEEFHDSFEEPSTEPVQAVEEPEERRYPLRNRVRRIDEDMVYNFHVMNATDPISVMDAMERSDKDLWMKAMKEEYDSLMENQTWELVDRPRDANVVKNKWIFKLKIGADGKVQRHKARLVAKGYSQKFGEDYTETFAPVVKLSSIRLLLGLSAELDLNVHHIDVTTAFLNGDLDEDLYMEQPESFIKKGNEKKVCKLKRAIYGLKQAARCWNVKVHDHITKSGFTRSKYDPCVYIKRGKDNTVIAIALYVDDFYIFGSSVGDIERVKKTIAKAFKIKDLGEAKDCLGIHITRSNGQISLSQASFAKKILEKYGMQDCKPVASPMELNLRLAKGERREDFSFQEVIGSLMYLSCGTRPDLTFAVSYLSQFNTCWNEQHMTALKRVLRYLKGTVDYKLVYERTGKPLVAYSDADWGANADGHSFTGYALIFGRGAVSWQARKQRCVALSTAEAEYIAICETAKELVCVKGLLEELAGFNDCVTVFSDSQSASKLVYSSAIGRRSKHINIRYHFIRELAEAGVIRIEYCDTNQMPADCLTKSLARIKLKYCMERMGIQWGC